MSFCREWHLLNIGDYSTLIREKEEAIKRMNEEKQEKDKELLNEDKFILSENRS